MVFVDIPYSRLGLNTIYHLKSCHQPVNIDENIPLAVSWQLREDPRLICCGNVPEQAHAYIAMSQDGRVVAIATNTSINLYNADTAELIDSLECIHSGRKIRIAVSFRQMRVENIGEGLRACEA